MPFYQRVMQGQQGLTDTEPVTEQDSLMLSLPPIGFSSNNEVIKKNGYLCPLSFLNSVFFISESIKESYQIKNGCKYFSERSCYGRRKLHVIYRYIINYLKT